MKRVWIAVFLLLLAYPGLAQEKKQQTVFGPEIDMVRPVKVPLSFLKQLTNQDREQLSRCQNDKELSSMRKGNVLDHFVGSRLEVRNPNGRTSLFFVRSNSLCFDGAHNSRFWLLEMYKPEKYRMLYEASADGLEVASNATRTFPNLEVFSHTAVEGYTDTVKYLRGKYRTTSCYVEALGDENPSRRRIKCENYHGEFRK